MINERTTPATLLHVHPAPEDRRDAFDEEVKMLRPVNPRAAEFMKLSRRVCLVRRKRAADATGFLVGPDLMLTSAHALLGTSTVFANPDDVTIVFDHFKWNVATKTDAIGDSCGLRRIPFTDQPDVVASSIKVSSRCKRRFDDNELDYILVRLDRPMGLTFLPYSHRIRGWNNCSRADAPAAGRVFVVQHPMGDVLQFAEGYIPASHDEPDFPRLFRYRTITLSGASGSAIFDQNRRVVGIHIGERSESEQLGVSFQSVFEDLEREGVKLPPFRLSKELMDSIFGSSETEQKRHSGNDWRGDRLFDDLDYD
jgi:hypothetical protein